jgi:Mn-dependent DtxR family transcriptional regulator
MKLGWMTPKAEAVLRAIFAHVSETGERPSYQKIADRLGVYRQAVHAMAIRLRERGMVTRGVGPGRTLGRSGVLELTPKGRDWVMFGGVS